MRAVGSTSHVASSAKPDPATCSVCNDSLLVDGEREYLVDVAQTLAERRVRCVCGRNPCKQRARVKWATERGGHPPLVPRLDVWLWENRVFPGDEMYERLRAAGLKKHKPFHEASREWTCEMVGRGLTLDHPMFNHIHSLFARRFSELYRTNEGNFRELTGATPNGVLFRPTIEEAHRMLDDYESGASSRTGVRKGA